jgi:chemotaxis response regulator CheB
MRRIADLQDRAELTQKQIQEVKKKVEVGMSAGTEIPKMEVELRSIQREIQDLQARLESGTATAGRSSGGTRGSADRIVRASTIDTSFTMDVGETVVVGTSRLKGGTKALIALLTAVPARASGAAR